MANPKQLTVALNEVGVKEVAGPRANPRVVEYFAAAHSNVTSDETAWCSAFMNWVWAQVGVAGTYNLMARSWLRWGVKADPAPGVVVVFPRGTGFSGHVAMIVEVQGDTLVCVGGNQGRTGEVSIARYKKHSALGFRKPKTLALSRTVQAQVVSGGASFLTLVSSTVDNVLPIADQASQFFEWAAYVSMGLAVVAAGCATYFKWQDIKAGRS